MAGAVVGIDLGTTNTVVAVVRGGKALVLADENGARLLPSVVSFHPNGEVLVGTTARERRLVDARNTVYSIKRLIGRSWQSDEVERARKRFPFELREGPTHGPLVVARNETYTLPEISAFVLRRIKAIAEKALGEAVERAVVTVPASFNDLQRASTKVAAREAGLEVLRILNEPTAAALAYGFGKTGSERIAVYDFGGGTFDLTLLDLSGNVFEVIATAGDSFLGGDDVDNVIADRIAMTLIQQTRFDPRGDVQVMERLRAAAEQVKIALSTQQEMNVELKEVGYGPGGAPIDLKFNMARTELEQLANPLVERTFNVCGEAMQLARLKNDAFDNIILVGGSTRIPLVRRKVEQFFAKKPLDKVNPDEVVAIGAAIQAAALTGAERRRMQSSPPAGDAVKQTRIQTLGGVGKQGQKGPLAPPPQRTTGRLVGAPLGDLASPRPATPTKSEQLRADAAEGVKLFEDDGSEETATLIRAAPLPNAAPPSPETNPPPPAGTQAYPVISGAAHLPGPGRPAITAPLVPAGSHRPLPEQKTTGRIIATPPASPAILNTPPPFDASPEPQTLPRGFPDHSPEPIQLQQVGTQRGRPTFEDLQARAQPSPLKQTQIASAPAASAPPQEQPQQQGGNFKSTQIASIGPATSPIFSRAAAPAPPGPPPIDLPPVPVRGDAPPNELGKGPLRTQLGMAAYPGRAAPPVPQLPSPQLPSPQPSPMFAAPSTGPRAEVSALNVPPMPFSSAPSSWPPAGTAGAMPLLIDVTPLTLSVETVGGYVDRVIARNTPVPCSQTRTFTTSSDNQAVVLIRVSQGESDSFSGNTALGQLELSGLRAARRGEVQIEVTFELDADGILQVRARDVETSRQTGAQMRLVGLDAPPPSRALPS